MLNPSLLSISLDESLLEKPRGNVLNRQLIYAKDFNQVTIIVPTTKRLQPKTVNNLTIIPTNSKSKVHYYEDIITLAQKHQFDIITTQDPFITGLAGTRLKKITGKPINIQCHTNFFHPSFYFKNPLNLILFFISKFTLPQANSIRVVSSEIKKSLSRFQSKVYLAPVPANLDLFLKTPHQGNKNQIVTVARLEKEKNLDSLINAFNHVKQSHPDWDLVVIGSGSQEKELKKIGSQVKFLGQKTPVEIAQIFATSKIYCQPSHYEGYGLSLLEALSAGLPVISTRVGVAPEVVNYKNGLLISSDQESIKKALLKLINSPLTPPKFTFNQPNLTDISKLLIKHTL